MDFFNLFILADNPVVLNIILILLGLFISLFGSLVGFGGGIFMVPILVSVFGYGLDIAAGTAMIALLPSSLISTILNRRKGQVDFSMGILLELPTIIGVIIGGFILDVLSRNDQLFYLEVVFTIMILILGVSFFIKKGSQNEKDSFFYKLNKMKPRYIIKNEENHVAYRASLHMVLFFGTISGALAGLFGVGGGFMKTPIMLKVFKIPAKIAAATALFMIIITSITGSIKHGLGGHIILEKAWPVVVGFSIGALLGYKVNTKLKEHTLEKMIGVSLLAASVMMFFNFIGGN